MLPVLLLLWLWCVSVTLTQPVLAADQSSSPSSIVYVDPELYNRALMHAKSLPNDNDGQSLVEQLQEGNIEALYSVAQSLNVRNSGDDRITSVQLWHALADGPSQHVLSAVALGFSYAEVDKKLALQYFIQASRGKERDRNANNGDDEENGPHQGALFNAGRLFLEYANDASSSLAYIRACANLSNEYPRYSTPQLSTTCTDAYNTLSSQIQSETVSPPGIQEAAEMFMYASIKEFPLPNTKEFAMYQRGMEYLDMFAALIRGDEDQGQDIGDKKKKGQTYLLSAQKELERLQNKSSDKMSELQGYLLNIIFGRVQLLVTTMETDSDEVVGWDEL